jgi:hemerythrin-like domain-containing protein
MSMHTPTTQVLRDEHRWILEVADVLQRVVEAEAETESLDMDAAEKCVRFIRLFADACHHGKEEDLLFVEMEHAGMSRSSGPIAVMLEEHRIGREFVGVMRKALDDAKAGESDAVQRFVNGAYGYVELIRNHILKEDHVLFDIADRIVDGPACKTLCSAYDGVCAQRFEGCTKAQLEELANELRDQYPAPTG